MEVIGGSFYGVYKGKKGELTGCDVAALYGAPNNFQ